MWRVGRDGCLYGEDFLIVKVGGGNTANIINYYFGRTYIAPQDVSQQLFNFNLTAIQAQMNSADIQTLVTDLQSVLGQALVSTASASDQVALNALQPRITALSTRLTAVNNSIQVCGRNGRGGSRGQGLLANRCIECARAFRDDLQGVCCAGQQFCERCDRDPVAHMLLIDQCALGPLAGFHHHRSSRRGPGGPEYYKGNAPPKPPTPRAHALVRLCLVCIQRKLLGVLLNRWRWLQVMAAISPLSENRHYTVQSPNGTIIKGSQVIT